MGEELARRRLTWTKGSHSPLQVANSCGPSSVLCRCQLDAQGSVQKRPLLDTGRSIAVIIREQWLMSHRELKALQSIC